MNAGKLFAQDLRILEETWASVKEAGLKWIPLIVMLVIFWPCVILSGAVIAAREVRNKALTLACMGVALQVALFVLPLGYVFAAVCGVYILITVFVFGGINFDG